MRFSGSQAPFERAFLREGPVTARSPRIIAKTISGLIASACVVLIGLARLGTASGLMTPKREGRGDAEGCGGCIAEALSVAGWSGHGQGQEEQQVRAIFRLRQSATLTQPMVSDYCRRATTNSRCFGYSAQWLIGSVMGSVNCWRSAV